MKAWLGLTAFAAALVCSSASSSQNLGRIPMRTDAERDMTNVCMAACDGSAFKAGKSINSWHCYCSAIKTCLWVDYNSQTLMGTIYKDTPTDEATCISRHDSRPAPGPATASDEGTGNINGNDPVNAIASDEGSLLRQNELAVSSAPHGSNDQASAGPTTPNSPNVLPRDNGHDLESSKEAALQSDMILERERKELAVANANRSKAVSPDERAKADATVEAEAIDVKQAELNADASHKRYQADLGNKYASTDNPEIRSELQKSINQEVAHDPEFAKIAKNGITTEEAQALETEATRKEVAAQSHGEIEAARARAATAAREQAVKDTKAAKEKEASRKSSVASSSDPCSGSVMTMVAKKAAEGCKFVAQSDCTPAQLADYANQNKLVSGVEEEYGCQATLDKVDFWENTNTMFQMGVTVAAGAAAGVATANTQKAFVESKGDAGATNKAALENMGTTLVRTGQAQIGVAIGQTLISARAYLLRRGEQKKIDEVRSTANQSSNVVDKNNERYQYQGLAAEMQTSDNLIQNARQRNSEGGADVDKSIREHKAAKKAADELALKTMISGAVNAATGAQRVAEGNALKQQAEALGPTQPADPTADLAPGESSGVLEDGIAPIVYNPGAVGSDESLATAEDIGTTGPVNGAPVRPPLFGGTGNSGGLKDGPKGGGIGGFVGPAGTGGSGGGAAALAGGGSGPGNAGGGSDKPSSADQIVGSGNAKFETGGGGFTAGAPGPGKKDDGTNMDMAGLLSQFMPKQGEEKDEHGANNPNFGGYGADNRSIASASEEQGGVLGPHGSLFLRVSSTTMGYYRKGQLR